MSATHLDILFVLDRYAGPTAGTERQICELARGLRERGHRIGFVLLQRSPWLEHEFADAPMRVVGSTRLRSPVFWRSASAAARWARGQGFRVAHIFLNDSALVFPWLLSRQGLQVVQARRDLGFWYTPARLRVLRFNRRWTRAVVANSRAVAASVAQAEGYRDDALHVIYNGVRPALAGDAEGAAIRAQLGLAAGDRLVLQVANLRALKRPQDAVEAVARLNAIDPTRAVHLALVGGDADGSGQQRRSLRQQAEQLGIGNRLHLPGQVDLAAPWVAAADACVLCSESEGLSNAVIEYMLAGRPVVCTDAGGNVELIDDGHTGYVVPVGDVPAITDRLARLLDNPGLAAGLGATARRRAMADFAVEAMLPRHESLYRSLQSSMRDDK